MSQKHWVAYLDLLGTRQLIESNDLDRIYSAYEIAIERALQQSKVAGIPALVDTVWFSDTFLFVGSDDSIESFIAVDQAARWFFYFMLDERIPLRGAIGFGELRFNPENKVVVGPALISAFDFAESQDWVNLSLTPGALEAIKRMKVPPKHLRFYKLADVPLHGNKSVATLACVMGSWAKSGNQGKNRSLKSLISMLGKIESPQIRVKYERAIAFIEKHQDSEGPSYPN